MQPVTLLTPNDKVSIIDAPKKRTIVFEETFNAIRKHKLSFTFKLIVVTAVVFYYYILILATS